MKFNRLITIFCKHIFIFILSSSTVFASYALNKTSTKQGNSFWEKAVLKMTANITDTNITFTVSKLDGGLFSSNGKMYLKVGSFETFGQNRGRSQSVLAGKTKNLSFSHNLDTFKGYPKLFYARYKMDNTDAFAWVGPIKVSYTTPPMDTTKKPELNISSPISGSSTLNSHITIKGEAYDTSRITSIKVRNITNNYIPLIAGLENWEATVELSTGNNIIEVIASNKLGNKNRKTINIIKINDRKPSITITTPTTDYKTTNALIDLSGTTSDTVGLSSITWKNNFGNSGFAYGIKKWDIPKISLKEGENRITVTVKDSKGNQASNVINIIRITQNQTIPTGLLEGLKGKFTIGDRLIYSLLATDGNELSVLSLHVNNSSKEAKFRKTWNVTGITVKKKGSFSTSGWSPGIYYVSFWVKNKANNTKEITRSFELIEKETFSSIPITPFSENTLPVLPIKTFNGTETSALMYGGIKKSIDLSFNANKTFSNKDALDIFGRIDVDPNDVGKEGSVFILAELDKVLYQKTANGDWDEWNLDVNSLFFRSYETLPEKINFTINDNSPIPIGDIKVFFGYKNVNTYIYNAESINFVVSGLENMGDNTLSILEDKTEEGKKPRIITPMKKEESYKTALDKGEHYFKFEVEPGYDYSFIVNSDIYHHLLSSKGAPYSTSSSEKEFQSEVGANSMPTWGISNNKSPAKSGITFRADSSNYKGKYYNYIRVTVWENVPVAHIKLVKQSNKQFGLPFRGLHNYYNSFGHRANIDNQTRLTKNGHLGIDIQPYVSTEKWEVNFKEPIIPIADGKVIKILNLGSSLGYAVWIEHNDYTSLYAHIQKPSVKLNKKVTKGVTSLGTIHKGQKHLHLEIFNKTSTKWADGYSSENYGQIDPLIVIFDK